jgi:ABC-type antimicrobial peptide transport system permease subunit
VVRTAGDPEALAAALAREVREIDPDLPLSSFRTMEQVVSDSLARPRFTALLLAIFSAVALALAAVGVYGVLVQAAARRTREVGLRMALGARPADVLRTLLAETLALAGTGVAAGLAGALLLTRILRAQLYGVSPTDPSTLAATAAAMLAVALAATWRPARSALRVDPAVALRSE